MGRARDARPARSSDYLAATTIDALSERILGRYEADYERDRPGLVRDAMSLIWAARRGLSEAELLDLLGSDGQPLPAAHWSPLSLAAGAIARAALRAHRLLPRLPSPGDRTSLPRRRATEREAVHLRLADYFDARRQERRAIDELPWQLAEAAAWQRLYDLLADREFFERAWARRASSRSRPTGPRSSAPRPFEWSTPIAPLIEEPAQHDHAYVWRIARLLELAGHPAEALPFVGTSSTTSVVPAISLSCKSPSRNLGVNLKVREELDQAMAL